MALQLCPAPLFLSSAPFSDSNTCTHLNCSSPSLQPEVLYNTVDSDMGNLGVELQPVVLGGGAVLATGRKPSVSPSPGSQSASIATTGSPYPPPPSSMSSVQMMPSDASFERESKRPRTIRRPSCAASRASTDLLDAEEDQNMDSFNHHLGMNNPQVSMMDSQPRSTVGMIPSTAITHDAYPTVGNSYWSGNFPSGTTMEKPASEDGDCTNSTDVEGQIPTVSQAQMYGNAVSWATQDIMMPMGAMQQYVPRRMVNGPWDANTQHPAQMQLQHQQMQSENSLVLPYHSSSAAHNNPHGFGHYGIANNPAPRIVPSNVYRPPSSSSVTATHPVARSDWLPPAFNATGDTAPGHGSNSNDASSAASMNNIRSAQASSLRSGRRSSTSPGKDGSRPKKSPIQQHATMKQERAKVGDRTTHNDVERKYRTNLKDRIAELRAAVPALRAQQDSESDGTNTNPTAPKVSKGTVLSKATEYIHQLERANQAMMLENHKLMERLQTLEAVLQNSGGPRPPQFVPSHGLAPFDPRGFS